MSPSGCVPAIGQLVTLLILGAVKILMDSCFLSGFLVLSMLPVKWTFTANVLCLLAK